MIYRKQFENPHATATITFFNETIQNNVKKKETGENCNL